MTVPKGRWADWLEEGDLANQEWSGQDYAFYLGGNPPSMIAGERVYIVAHGKLRGYSPLRWIDDSIGWNRFALIRGGDAVAVTIREPIVGFQGWRYRWWKREDELPFTDWRQP